MNPATLPAPVTIGIVTVLYNSDDVLDDFFTSLARQVDVQLRLYVVDNSPSESGLERARTLASAHGVQATFLFNNANLGVATGNNQGIAMARADGCSHVLLANNDTEFADGTLSTLLDEMHRVNAPAATPKMLFHGTDLIWYAGGRFDLWTMRVPHKGLREPDRGQHDQAEDTAYAPTCFLMIRASVFDGVGVMDERYFVYYDDTDFLWRLALHGVRVRYVPRAVVAHKVSTSTGGDMSPFTLYYTNRNRMLFIRKHLHGVRRLFAMSYMLATRLAHSVSMPRALSGRMWAGLRDGWQLPLEADASHVG